MRLVQKPRAPILLSVDHRGGTRFGPNFERAFPLIEAWEQAGREVRLLNVNASLDYLTRQVEQNVVFVLADTFAPASEGAKHWPEAHGFRRWLERAGAAYVGSTFEGMRRASSTSKPRTRRILTPAGVRVPQGRLLTEASHACAERALRVLGAPLVVKQPSDTGGGVGVHLADSAALLLELITWHQVARGQVGALVEAFVRGREVTVWVLEARRRPFCYGIIETRKPASMPLLDRGAKIRCRNVKRFSARPLAVPEAMLNPSFPPRVRACIEATAIRAHQACRLRHYSRVDMIVSEGVSFVLDVNAAPEISRVSLGWAASARGENLSLALERLIAEALAYSCRDGRKPV